MGRIKEHSINAVLDAIDLRQFVQDSGTMLRKTHGSSVGLCPIHGENTPSFHVHPTHFKCFGCGAGGNVFTFISETRELDIRHDFPQIVRIAAEFAGIEVEEEEDHRSLQIQKAHREKLEKRKVYVAIHKAAQEFFTSNLRQNEKTRSYLNARCIGYEQITQLGIGLAPNAPDLLYRSLRAQGFAHGDVIASGLVRSKGGGRVYDLLRDRITFPVLADFRGSHEIIAFSGRNQGGKGAKYLNSPSTAFYQKSDHLFGFVDSLPHIKQRKELLLVEGCTDVAAIKSSSIPAVAALLGTSITENQLRSIKRFCPDIHLLIAFDGDEAGRKATMRAVEMIASLELRTSVVHLPDGKDPGDLVLDLGREEVQDIVESDRSDALLWAFSHIVGDQPPSASNAANAVQKCLELVRKIPSTITAEAYCEHIAHITRANPKTVLDLYRNPHNPTPPKQNKQSARAQRTAHPYQLVLAPLPYRLLQELARDQTSVRICTLVEDNTHKALTPKLTAILSNAYQQLLNGAQNINWLQAATNLRPHLPQGTKLHPRFAHIIEHICTSFPPSEDLQWDDLLRRTIAFSYHQRHRRP